jgi:SAM-dependent methyltransferase
MYNKEIEILTKAYDAGIEEEILRLEASLHGKTEFANVCNVIEKYIQKTSVVYDIGSGPGKYSELLLNKGHFVGSVDLSLNAINFLKTRIENCNSKQILFHETCCATQLDWIKSESADVVLLFGPMYHLTDEICRQKVIKNCNRILKKDGVLLSIFMSSQPILFPQLNQKTNSFDIEIFEKYVISYVLFQGFIVPQFRCLPNEAIAEFQNYFNAIETVNIDRIENCDNKSHQFLVVFEKK